ncbi:MAG: hypothetical protein ACPGQS_12620, partial [Bradymonadia bacterium]
VMYRTQIAEMFGMESIRAATGPTYRLPFLEIARELQYGDRRTLVTVETSNAVELAIPKQVIEVVWKLMPETFLSQQMQPLINSAGIDALVRTITQNAISKILGSTQLGETGESIGFDQSVLMSHLQSALAPHRVRVSKLTTVNPQIPASLFKLHQEHLDTRHQLDVLSKRKTELTSQRTESLAKIKNEAEDRLATMLSQHGTAMAALQENLDTASRLTEAEITENRLSAQTDREIYQLQAQHLMTVYKNRASNFRRFLEANPKLHPKLHTIAPESLETKIKHLPLPLLRAPSTSLQEGESE